MEYIIILVDKKEKHHDTMSIQTENVRVDVIAKGQQMVGLRFKHTRPTLIIDEIKERTLKNHKGEEIFEQWWTHCVVPNSIKAQLISLT